MVTVDGMKPPRLKWIKSMNTKYSRTMAKPNMIQNKENFQCISRITENQSTPDICMQG